MAEPNKKILASNRAAKKLADSAGSLVGMAFQPALEYILTIGTNNPREKTIKRPDIKAAIAHTADAALAKASQTLHSAWDEGVTAGVAHAASEARRFKIKVSGASLSTAARKRLLGDLESIMASAQAELLRSYLADGEDGLKAAQKRLAWRTSLAVEAAYKHGRSEAVDKAFLGKGLYKQWVTTSSLPCSNCLALASLAPIPWEDEFPDVIEGVPILKVYAKRFLGPPRHPNCGCVLVLVEVGSRGES